MGSVVRKNVVVMMGREREGSREGKMRRSGELQKERCIHSERGKMEEKNEGMKGEETHIRRGGESEVRRLRQSRKRGEYNIVSDGEEGWGAGGGTWEMALISLLHLQVIQEPLITVLVSPGSRRLSK